MSRRGVIVVLTCALFVSQVVFIGCWLSLPSLSERPLSVMTLVAATVLAGCVDVAICRHLLVVLGKMETSYALGVASRLDQALEEYRAEAEREQIRMREIGAAIEAELDKAHDALDSGDYDEADACLQNGLDIASQAHMSYCENVAVAAVLDNKARQCAESGVRLVPQVSLPEPLPIESVEIAALFFNLIDNALHECEWLIAERVHDDPEITVRAWLQAGQLLVTVSNPCRKGVEASRRAVQRRAETGLRHGWGTSIVTEISESHGGIAEFEERDAVFTASVMIPLPATEG